MLTPRSACLLYHPPRAMRIPFNQLALLLLLAGVATACRRAPQDGTISRGSVSAMASASSPSVSSTPPPASAALSTTKRVSGAEARALVAKGALLVDVRTPGEFQADGIEGAINISHDQIEVRAAELGPKERPLVVFCHSGRRSGMAARALSRMGYAVYDLGPRSAW